MTDSSAEALRRRSKTLIVIVGYPEAGWSASTRREPSEPFLSAAGYTVDEACARLLALLDVEESTPPKRKLVRKR